MDKVPNIKAKVAAYLQRAPEDYNVNGIDLLLDAINKAHQWMQLQHDFELAKVIVDVPVYLPDGALFSPAKIHGSDQFTAVKRIIGASLSTQQGGMVPIDFVNRGSQLSQLRRDQAGWVANPQGRPDVNYMFGGARPYLFQAGEFVYLSVSDASVVGPSPVQMVLDVVRILPDLKDEDTSQDFLTEYGDDFIFWDSVCRLNTLNKEFVTRQEGNIAEPTDKRDAAWEHLLRWDSGLLNVGNTAFSLD